MANANSTQQPTKRQLDFNLDRDLEFLYEIGCLRHIQRTWRQFLNPDFQNLSDHILRVVWIALTLAKYEGVTNTEKIMKMAIVHDLSESRSVDSHYVSRQYVDRHEEEALTDTLFDTAVGEEFLAIWREYEEKDCIEAKIVKDADTLDVDLELKEQEFRGLRLGEDTFDGRMYVAQNKLYTDAAKDFFYAIQSSNPNDWHVKGKNRFTSGDWRRKSNTE